MKVQSEPKPKPVVVHKVVQTKSKVHKTDSKSLDYGIHFVNEKQFPMFEKYKSSVMPFIQSQYPTNFVVDITITNVKMDNWKMEIFYNTKITESNYYSYTQNGLNYTCDVRSNVPIPNTSTYNKTNSTIYASHYEIPANTTYLNVNVDGQSHVEFLVNGSGVCNVSPTINSKLTTNEPISSDKYSSTSSKPAPYIYSIIDADGVTSNGFVNANAATLKYNLSDTPIYAVNKIISLPANIKLYYYPSVYAQEIVSTNSPVQTTATKEIMVNQNQYMYLVNIQGQEGWVLAA